MPDLNVLPNQLNEEEFLELNDLLNPVQPNDHPEPDIPMADLDAMVNPVIMNGPINEADLQQAEDNQSELTLTISSDDSTASDAAIGVVNQGFIQQNFHIGMVLIQEQVPDLPLGNLEGNNQLPVHDTFLFSKEGTLAWASFFKPTSPLATSVTVPAQWADFFTAKLLTPEDFDWAKNLMQSKVWQILSDLDVNTSSRDFVLPKHCPASTPPLCLLSQACLDATQGFSTPQAMRSRQPLVPTASTSVVRVKRKASSAPLCASDVRRSPRISAANKGFRVKTCFDKNCLACASVAPPIKKSVVKNLCNKFSIHLREEEEQIPPSSSTSRQTKPAKKTAVTPKKQVSDADKKSKKK
jgi:hypothetical protein